MVSPSYPIPLLPLLYGHYYFACLTLGGWSSSLSFASPLEVGRHLCRYNLFVIFIFVVRSFWSRLFRFVPCCGHDPCDHEPCCVHNPFRFIPCFVHDPCVNEACFVYDPFSFSSFVRFVLFLAVVMILVIMSLAVSTILFVSFLDVSMILVYFRPAKIGRASS